MKKLYDFENVGQAYNFMLTNEIASEETLAVITSINGYNIDTLNDVLYCQSGYHNFEQLYECEEENYSWDDFDEISQDDDEEDDDEE